MKALRRCLGIAWILSVLCTGCALHGYWHVVGREPGPFTESEKAKVKQDLEQCQHYAIISHRNVNQCMVEKGYEWVRGNPPDESYDPLK